MGVNRQATRRRRCVGHVCRPIVLVAAGFLITFITYCSHSAPRVLVLGFDGLDPRALDLLISEGALPNFARLRLEGAYGRLISSEPMLSPILWTTIATGRTPDVHGIAHFVAVDPQTGEPLPVTSDLRRVPALWNILSAQGKTTAVVGWWATFPPEPIRGWVVSDHLAYHFLFGDGLAAADPTIKTHPPELQERLAPLVIPPSAIGRAELAPFASVDEAELASPLVFTDGLAHLRWLVATTETHRRVGLALWAEERPDVEMVYFEGTDSVAHLFGHLFRARGLAGELAEQQARFGSAVEAMYRRADAIVGDFLAALDGGTTLIVLSDHGFALGRLHDDPSRVRDLRRVSARFHELEGVLFLRGRNVRSGARIEKPVHVDIVPTILALLGLPAAQDMPGRVLSEALIRNEPSDRIDSYDLLRPDQGTANTHDALADRALIERLESLGYLQGTRREVAEPAGVPSHQAERNLAGIAFERRAYAEAERRYRALVDQDPDDAGLRSSYAAALGALGRFEEALQELDAALAVDPINAEAFHNKAVALERMGEVAEAITLYREAVRYRPDFEPSRRALLRLTGSAMIYTPRSPAEARALSICERSAEKAQRGDYGGALADLEEAKEIAPDLVLIHQYESNIAYLAGDPSRAVAALERALALEPDNALFRHNLGELKRRAAPVP